MKETTMDIVKKLGTKSFWDMVGNGTVKGLCIAAKATMEVPNATIKATKFVGDKFQKTWKDINA